MSSGGGQLAVHSEFHHVQWLLHAFAPMIDSLLADSDFFFKFKDVWFKRWDDQDQVVTDMSRSLVDAFGQCPLQNLVQIDIFFWCHGAFLRMLSKFI